MRIDRLSRVFDPTCKCCPNLVNGPIRAVSWGTRFGSNVPVTSSKYCGWSCSRFCTQPHLCDAACGWGRTLSTRSKLSSSGGRLAPIGFSPVVVEAERPISTIWKTIIYGFKIAHVCKSHYFCFFAKSTALCPVPRTTDRQQIPNRAEGLHSCPKLLNPRDHDVGLGNAPLDFALSKPRTLPRHSS